MPSSPGPTDYKRSGQRFIYRGISLLPQDMLADGKANFSLNIRSHQEGTVEPRYGEIKLTASALPGPIHSLFRLNDSTLFAGSNTARRILGVNDTIYGGTPGVDSYGAIGAAGFSGDPLSAVVATPAQSPRPYLYIGDRTRMRKVNTDLTDYPIGIAQPNDPPTGVLVAPEITFLDTVGTAAWTAYGGVTTPAAPTPTPTTNRVNTTITQLIYDLGASGMASVSLADFDNVTAGMTLDIGASAETVIVQSVLPPVSSTTIAAILYDSGNTGLCTIQPTGSFSVGQIEAALPIEIERRYRDLALPVPPRVTVTRTVDFPVDCLILLNGVEVVRILSVAIGPDGVQSFRCNTTNTFAAGDTIAGLASFRAYFNTTKSVGDPAVALALDVTVTPPTTTDPVVGGVQVPLSGPTRNWALVGTRATTPEDIIRFGIKVNELGYVQSVRLVLDLSPTGPPFLRDYLFYEWRAADLITAIQAASETATGLVADAQANAVQQGQTDALYTDQYGQDPNILAVSRTQPPGSPTVGIAVPRNTQAAQDGLVSIGAGLSRQLQLGNDAWMTLECRVGDLTRVGSDTTLTLGVMQNAAIYAQFLGSTDAIDLQISDCYLIGGYGPDVGTILPPYVYRYSYRSTITGARSNTSPPMRAGVTPRRGRVELDVLPSLDPQCDVIDFWRFGGALARWTYVGTTPNDALASPFVNSFDDDMSDTQIDGGESPRVDLYQPWPTSDLPRSGTCNVAGTAIEWVSGDLFDLDWAADSIVIINGRATQLYRSPSSTTFLEVVDNCGSGTAVPFSLPSPTLLHQPLGGLFGGFVNDVWFNFGVGDPDDPGALHWTNGNDPDSASDANVLYVSNGDEPLLTGYFDDGIPYVHSTAKLYRIVPNFGGQSAFLVSETGCQRGLWSRWFCCKHPDGGWFFGNKDGIYFTRGGGAAESIIDPDLRPLFPQEGTAAEAIRNLNPIDFTQTDRLRLSFVDQVLYFDYLDTSGESHTLVYEPRYQRWTPDAYAVGVVTRLGEGGPQVEDQILASVDGNLRQVDLNSLIDVATDDSLVSIPWAIWTVWTNDNDPRAFKQFGDGILDFNPGGSIHGVIVTPTITNGNILLAPQTLGIGDNLRDTYMVDVSQGIGQWSRNFGLRIEGNVDPCDTQRPLLYLWEVSYLWKNVSVIDRATDWEDLGYKGAKFVQGVVLRANTFGLEKLLQIEFDGPLAAPQVAMTLPILHNGEQSIAYPQLDLGWQPFLAQLVRLRGIDDVPWVLYDWRFIWEPAPEAATQWETQETTFDLPGYMTVRDGVIALISDAPVDVTIWHDANTQTYSLPSTGGEYQRIYMPCVAAKGKFVKFQWNSVLPFRLFKSDCSVRVQGWGRTGGYQVLNPFGGPSRVDGAGI